MILYPGFKLGKYAIKEQLGVPGSYGVVYRAVEDFTGREVAIKELFEAGDQTELQVLAKLSHPSIIQYVTYEILNNTHFLVMEYAQEGNLAEIITRRGCLPENEALEIFKQLAGALAFAHRQNIVHRDIKPLNVMCCQGNFYKFRLFCITVKTIGRLA